MLWKLGSIEVILALLYKIYMKPAGVNRYPSLIMNQKRCSYILCKLQENKLLKVKQAKFIRLLGGTTISHLSNLEAHENNKEETTITLHP